MNRAEISFGKGYSGGRACGEEVRSPGAAVFFGACWILALVHFFSLCSTCSPSHCTDGNLLLGHLEQGWGENSHFTALRFFLEAWDYMQERVKCISRSSVCLPNFSSNCSSSRGPSSLELGLSAATSFEFIFVLL